MAIVKEILASGYVSEDIYFIAELVEDDSIHCHVGELRISMSKEEFRDFSKCVVKAKNSLEEIKNGV